MHIPKGHLVHPEHKRSDLGRLLNNPEVTKERVTDALRVMVEEGVRDPEEWAAAIISGHVAGIPTSDLTELMNKSGLSKSYKLNTSVCVALHIAAMRGEVGIFDIDLTLSEALTKTSFKGVTLSEMRLPKPVIYLNAQGYLDIEGIYLTFTPESGSLIMSICRWSPDDVDTHAEWRTSILLLGGNLSDDKALTEVAEQTVDFTFDTKAVLHWAFNVMLYITHVATPEHWILEPEARKLWEKVRKEKNPKRRRKAASKLKGLPCHRRKRIIDRTLIAEMDKERKGSRGPVAVKSLVIGIWRRPPGYRKREPGYKLVWVKPHWRGPKDAPESKRRWKVRASGVK